MSMIVNPGSGPVSGGTRQNAVANVHAFIQDVTTAGRARRGHLLSVTGPEGGRWTCLVDFDGTTVEIGMPGLPLKEVRYVDPAEQDLWDFPRLYVNGSSWFWMFALQLVGSEPVDAPDPGRFTAVKNRMLTDAPVHPPQSAAELGHHSIRAHRRAVNTGTVSEDDSPMSIEEVIDVLALIASSASQLIGHLSDTGVLTDPGGHVKTVRESVRELDRRATFSSGGDLP